jgi:hypothetical protein
MEQTDIWSINPSISATFFKTAAVVTGGVFPRALTLTNTNPVVAKEGAGYRLVFTSAGNDSGITFTINGTVVGNLVDGPSSVNYPEVVTGGNAGAVNSVYYYSRIDSIVISGAAAGTVAVGTVGSLALPRCRVKGFYIVGGAGAGSLKIDRHTHTTNLGTVTTVPPASSVHTSITPGIANNILDVTTPAGATLTQFLSLPGQGILTGQQQNDFSVVVDTGLTDYTLFCG